ncbi:alpha/beta hydrolase [Halosegnis marinus]|uniref:Alpha/beta hydrolase n=1 Tax=Halosegnis marinus TaxID=3034023 RepID=A0ABD5ZK36_9EURY|nr:alpha/beta hydrolase [Halosegnis sp. DT85]
MRADEPHADVQTLLARVEAADVLPLAQYDADTARAVSAQMRSDAEGPDLGGVEDRTIPGPAGEVPVRVYRPEGEGPFPTVVFYHGGGWVIGDLDGYDLLCRHIAAESGCVVVSVHYRRAPEHPYPAAAEDAYAALEWVADNPDALDASGKVAVMGDSAGGNLAASVTLRSRDEDGPAIDYQALVYPSVSPSDEWESREQNGEGYYLNDTDMAWFAESYFGEGNDEDPYAFPLVADSHADLPPATVVTAGFDPIRDEGIAYAEALEAAGVAVEHHHYPDMIHAFFSMLAEPAELDAAHDAVGKVAADLRAALD